MKADFWLINKNKRASERIRILHHKAPAIDYLLFTGAKLIHPHIVAILFKQNLFVTIAIFNAVVPQVVKNQIKSIGKPRNSLGDLKARKRRIRIAPNGPSNVGIVKRLYIDNELIDFRGKIT